jgi:hypothetical protein
VRLRVAEVQACENMSALKGEPDVVLRLPMLSSWHDSDVGSWAEHVRSAQVIQTSSTVRLSAFATA